jgi:hypothetical protein
MAPSRDHHYPGAGDDHHHYVTTVDESIKPVFFAHINRRERDPHAATSPAGWNLVFSDNFNTNVAAGSWPGPYASRWTAYLFGGYEGVVAECREQCRLGIGELCPANDEAVPVTIRGLRHPRLAGIGVVDRDPGRLVDCLDRSFDRWVLRGSDRVSHLVVPTGLHGMAGVKA